LLAAPQMENAYINSLRPDGLKSTLTALRRQSAHLRSIVDTAKQPAAAH
jgi:hypothetical protein